MYTVTDALRQVAWCTYATKGRLGLTRHTVSLRIRDWSGSRPGLGTATDTLTLFTVEDGYAPPLSRISGKDVSASNGRFQQNDLRLVLVQPFTLNNISYGYDYNSFNPPVSGTKEILWKITNYDEPVGWYTKVEEDLSSQITWTITLRKTASK